MVDSVGGIGSSGLSSFDLGGIAPNGGGPAPTGTGALGDAGLSPIGSTGLTAFGLDGPVGGQSEAAKLDRYDSLVQQNWDQLNANAQSNADLSRSIAEMGQTSNPPAFTMQPIEPPRFVPPPPAFPTFTLPPTAAGSAPLPTPPAFAGQPLDAAGFAPLAPTAPTFTLPEAAGGPVPAAPKLADLPAPIPAAPFTPVAMAPDALASPVVKPDIAAPVADPFAPIAAGGLGLSPVGAPTLTAFGLAGPAPVAAAETGIAPTTEGAAAFAGLPSTPYLGAQPVAEGLFASPAPLANQTGLLGPTPEATTSLAFNPAPIGQWAGDGTPPLATPAAPPILGYGDQPLGVPVSQIGRLTSADAQAYVGQRIDAFRTAATPAEQDAVLQDALNGAYAFRVQGGDTGPFDRIAEGLAGDPRTEIELKVARDRAEAIVAAGVSGNVRALNDNGVNFGAQLYALQRSVTNDPDNALGPISRSLDALRYGEGAGSAVNDIQAGATRQALAGLGFGREVQDAAALDAARTEAAQVAQRQALAQMSPSERLSYLAGQALDAGALAAGPALAATIAGGRAPAAPQAAGNISYGPLDTLGRPTGVQATVTKTMIGTGTAANPSIIPPGWSGNGALNNEARGHLLGRQLGGSGDRAENLVTLQQNPANSPAMRGFENQVRAAVEGGQQVRYGATPIYNGQNLVPRGITLNGTGTGGFDLNVTVLNPPGR